MGRMLDTLKLGEGRRNPHAVSKPVEVVPVQDCVVDWEIGEEVPYVEVGGPNKKVELSPGLVQHPPQGMPQPPHLMLEKAPLVAKSKAPSLTVAKPMTAAFEPWPGHASAPLGIALEIIAYHQPEHPTSKAYASLLETMRAGLQADTANVLLFIGLKPHVGASTVLLNLAVSAAMQKARVVVVDANGQRDSLAQRLGHAASAGLVDVIDGTLALEQAIVKTALATLHVVPAGAPTKKHPPLTSEALAWLMAWLRERYDLIFMDGPTLGDAADLLVQVPRADGTYLVLPQSESASINKRIAQMLSRMGGRLCGLIHTHIEM